MHARADGGSDQAQAPVPSEVQAWPEDIFQVLQRFEVRQVAYVPDAGHSQLIERVLAAAAMRAVPLTTEEEGVALLAGAWAGGQRGVLLMQSSGVGNCVNMLSLTQILRFPFLTLVTMRGEWGEFNPWQVPMGSTTAGVFELCGVRVLRATSPGEVREVVEAAASQAYNACTPTAVLLSQRLIGAKVFIQARDDQN
jgi:sulfopyruvate decarboxylase alpha subunit